MATTREEIAKLQKHVKQLKKENAVLWRVLREHGIAPKDGKRAAAKEKRALSDNERAVEILRRAGMIRELTPEEKAMAARWDALPEKRKQHVIQKLKTTKFHPPLSETIIQDRG
jgi:hypothetical protein